MCFIVFEKLSRNRLSSQAYFRIEARLRNSGCFRLQPTSYRLYNNNKDNNASDQQEKNTLCVNIKVHGVVVIGVSADKTGIILKDIFDQLCNDSPGA